MEPPPTACAELVRELEELRARTPVPWTRLGDRVAGALLEVTALEDPGPCVDTFADSIRQLLARSPGESGWIRQVIAGFDEALERGGLRRRPVARSTHALARLLVTAERWPEAEIALETAARAYAGLPDSVDEHIDALHGLGWVRGRRGDVDGSIEALREAVTTFDTWLARTPTGDPVDTMLPFPLAMELARRLEEAGELAEAESYLRRVLAEARDYLGPDDPMVVLLHGLDLADFQRRTGEPEAALAAYEEAVQRFGRDGRMARLYLDGLGLAQHALSREHEAWLALSDWTRLLESYEYPMSTTPRRAAEAAELYATMLRERGRDDEAARMDARAEAFREDAERWGL